METLASERDDGAAVASVSVFFPCFNDASTIGGLIRAALAVLDARELAGDVTVVNDGSTDGSAVVLAEVAATEPRVRPVTHPVNSGYGAALQSGFAAATGEWVFYTDGDGQYDPSELAVLLAEAGDDVDVVQGYKLVRADNWARRVIGRAWHHMVSIMFGLKVRDTDCDFRLIRRSILEEFQLESTSGVICVELVRRLHDANARFVEVGVHHYPQSTGRSTFFRPRNVLKTLVGLFALWWRMVVRPALASAIHAGGTRRGRRAAFIGAALGLFTTIYLTSLRTPLDRADEAWFLWVAVRTNSGARLYHDVYFVSTPLAMWVMQLGVWLFGVHLWVERALVAASVTASTLLVWLIAERLGLRRSRRLLVCALTVLFAMPAAHFVSAYSTLAMALALGTLWVLIRGLQAIGDGRSGTRAVAVAGGLSALTFAAKPNIGLAAVVAVTVAVLAQRPQVSRPRRRVRTLAIFGTAWASILAILAAPLVVSGTFGAMVSDVFAGKGSVYLQVEGTFTLQRSLAVFGFLTHPAAPLGANVERAVGSMPIVAAVLLGWTVTRIVSRRDGSLIALCAFAGVGAVAAAPDFAPQHLTEAAPLLLALPIIGLMVTATPRPAPKPLLRTIGAAVTSVAVVVSLIGVANWARRPQAHPDTIAVEQAQPVAGVITTSTLVNATRSDLEELRSDTHGTVYLAFLSASYYYLVGHLRDPSPYDYPGRSDLGAGGEPGLIATLRHHHVQWICIPNRPVTAAIRPQILERYVRTHDRFVERLHVCDLYTTNPSLADL